MTPCQKKFFYEKKVFCSPVLTISSPCKIWKNGRIENELNKKQKVKKRISCKEKNKKKNFAQQNSYIKKNEEKKYRYHEIYNEDIHDLLGPDAKRRLDLKEHPDKGVYVPGMSYQPIPFTPHQLELFQ